jgi:hypothetical protein
MREKKNELSIHSFSLSTQVDMAVVTFSRQSFEHIHSYKTRRIILSIAMVIRDIYRLKKMAMTLVIRYKVYTYTNMIILVVL